MNSRHPKNRKKTYFCPTMQQSEIFKKVISHAKEYGFIFQSSEIYDGLSAVYDYGQNGVTLKKTYAITGGKPWYNSMKIS